MDDYMRQMQEREMEDSYELLTSREREILQLLAEGNSNKEVATLLNLSLYTVETHRGNILEKLNISQRSGTDPLRGSQRRHPLINSGAGQAGSPVWRAAIDSHSARSHG